MFDSQTRLQPTLIDQPHSSQDVSLLTRHKTIVLLACTSVYMTIAFEELFAPNHIYPMRSCP